MSKSKKKYWEMTTQELAEATKEFDREGVMDTFREMTPAEEAAWRAATKKQSKSHDVPTGVKVISLGIAEELLDRADALARKRRISRARLISEGLEAVLAKRSRKTVGKS